MYIILPALATNTYTINNNSMHQSDEATTWEIYPHTLHSPGFVNITLTPKAYSGNITLLIGFKDNEKGYVSKIKRYNPHWANSTTNQSMTLYNVSQFKNISEIPGISNIGNIYNKDTFLITYDSPIYDSVSGIPIKYKTTSINVTIDSYTKDDENNYTISWHTRHDQLIHFDKKNINHTNVSFNNFNKWYTTKGIPVSQGNSSTFEVWVDFPISLDLQQGEYYVAYMPEEMDMQTAINTGSFWFVDPWWHSSWNCCKVCTINQSMVNQSIDNAYYPLLLSITDANLSTKAQQDGYDIVFTNSGNTTQLPHGIEYWNSTLGIFVARINVTDIKNVSSIIMYYNNSGATNTQDSEGVWDSNFVMVQHLNETPTAAIIDSTSYDNDGTTVNLESSDQITGKIDGSIKFDGVNEGIEISDSPSISLGTDDFTFTAWVSYLESTSKNTILGKEAYGGVVGYSLRMQGDGATKGKIRLYMKDADDVATGDWYPGTAVTEGEFHRITVSGDRSGNAIWYLDGDYDAQADISAHSASIDNIEPLFIGKMKGNSNPFNGTLDEVRISNIIRSPAYIQTSYNNSAFPSLFVSMGPEILSTEHFDINVTYQDRDNSSYNIIFETSNITTISNWSFNYSETESGHNYHWRYENHTLIQTLNATSNNQTLNFSVGYLLPEGKYYINESSSVVTDTKFEYWDGSSWVEGPANYYLWFTCFWWTPECPNAEQSDSQPTLRITSEIGPGTPKLKLNESAPAGIRIFVDDDNTFAGAVELTNSYQAVSTYLNQDENTTLWAWANMSGADYWDFEIEAIVE